MPNSFSALFIAFVALSIPASVAAQQAPLALDAPLQPEVRLEAHEGKTHFYVGERMQFDLVFSNHTGKPVNLNATLYQDLAEYIEITPATGWFEWRTKSGHDYAMPRPLGPDDCRFPIVLNQGYAFREPGHYQIRMTTRRINWKGPLTTNEVAIDLESIPDGVEAGMIADALKAIGPADMRMGSGNPARGKAMGRLADLQSDQALRAKIDLILSGDEQMRSYSQEAIANTRNLALALQLLETAWRNPQQMPLWDMPGLLAETRTLLRGKSLQGWKMAVRAPQADDPEVKRAAEGRTTDMKVLLDTLPERTGSNRAAALYYLLEFPGLNDAEVARTRPLVAAEFQTLNQIERNMLLETAWPRLRGPAMITPLKTLLATEPQNKDALQRLVELDPQAAKPFVVQAICGRGWPVPLNSVAALPFDTLPDIDACLGDLLSTPPEKPYDNPWSMRAALAARFATAAILPQVRTGWKYPEQDREVLPLLLRWAPDEAMEKIRGASADQNRLTNLSFNINTSYTSRHAVFPTQMLDLLHRLLVEGTDSQAGFAAYELSQAGDKKDHVLLEARLDRLRKQWPGKDDQLQATVKAGNAQAAVDAQMLEIELVGALRRGYWPISDDELDAITQGCLSSRCRIDRLSKGRSPAATQ